MNDIYRQYGKRMFDLCFASALLVLLSPILMVIAATVWLRLGKPILFCQMRPGRNSKLFRMYKFRSMHNGHDESGRPLPDADRLTRFGRLLRASSLDELPELWNVVCGDMSLVGPRPLLTEYLPLYSPTQMRRHEVRPGITGWAQVQGRNAIDWERRFAYDVEYVDRVSLRMDLRILAQTVGCVLASRGISAHSHCTMTPFLGRNGHDARGPVAA
jgi:lipopolysaccharide/colanic/teichoic acid biosynthesis glycosyltransferase